MSLRRGAARGFTLLEVLVAVAILGLGLTIVSSAQTGVFWSYARATKLSQAPGLARCKMAELELQLLKLGYPLLDEHDEGDCCDTGDLEDYRCEWAIETVILPSMPLGAGFGGDAGVPGAALGSAAPGSTGADGTQLPPSGVGGGLGGGLGPLGGLAQLQQSGGTALGAGAGIGDLSQMMAGGLAGGGVAGMVMGLVYPDLKPMLEASIRKLTVTVRWKEGSFDRDLVVVQYVTSPQQGGFDPNAAMGLGALGDQAASAGIGGLLGAGQGLLAPGGLKP